jgi:GT2 family glycosyltransferase
MSAHDHVNPSVAPPADPRGGSAAAGTGATVVSDAAASPRRAARREPLLKSAERMLRRLRTRVRRDLERRRLMAAAGRIDLAALARTCGPLPRPEFVAVCLDDAPAAAAACTRCLDSARRQALPFARVALVAPAATLARIDAGGAATTLVALDAFGGSVVTALRHVVAGTDGTGPGTARPVALGDAAATLCDDASLWITATWARRPGLRALYADHVEVDDPAAAAAAARPCLKPRFSWIHLLARDLAAPLTVYDRSWLAAALDRSATAPVPATGPGALYTVALEALGGLALADVAHVAEPLAVLPDRPAAVAAAVARDRAAACAAALGRRGVAATVRPLAACPAVHDIAVHRATSPRVSIIIPTKNAADLVFSCVSSLRAAAGYEAYDITVIDHASDEPALLAYLAREEAAGGLRVFPYAGPFNFAALNNAAVKATDGEWLLFLNNDVTDFSPHWLDELVAVTELDPSIAAVGVRLRYPDGDLQHGGAILDRKRVCLHLHRGRPAAEVGYLGRPVSLQEFSAVTAACVLVRRSAFLQLGGFDERFPDDYNDIDLCLRLRRAGYRVVYAPRVEAVHHESKTRRVGGTRRDLFVSRWAAALERDDFFHPYLSPTEFGPDGLERVWQERKRVALGRLVATPLPRPAPRVITVAEPGRGKARNDRRAA